MQIGLTTLAVLTTVDVRPTFLSTASRAPRRSLGNPPETKAGISPFSSATGFRIIHFPSFDSEQSPPAGHFSYPIFSFNSESGNHSRPFGSVRLMNGRCGVTTGPRLVWIGIFLASEARIRISVPGTRVALLPLTARSAFSDTSAEAIVLTLAKFAFTDSFAIITNWKPGMVSRDIVLGFVLKPHVQTLFSKGERLKLSRHPRDAYSLGCLRQPIIYYQLTTIPYFAVGQADRTSRSSAHKRSYIRNRESSSLLESIAGIEPALSPPGMGVDQSCSSLYPRNS